MQDDSRALASMLFPELSPLLKRKKDHGKLIFFFDHGKDSEAIASLYFNIWEMPITFSLHKTSIS